jgi:hypothetical protein
VDEVFGEGAVEPLHRSVHLGAPGIAVVVRDIEFRTRIVEVVGEFASVVCLYLADFESSNPYEFLEKVFRRCRRVIRIRASRSRYQSPIHASALDVESS